MLLLCSNNSSAVYLAALILCPKEMESMRFFQGLFKARDKPVDGRPQNALGGSRYSFFFGNTTSGKPVTERTAMQMTAVYSCVRILSEAVAGLPIHVYRYTDNGGKEKALEHPLYRLLHDEPNPEMTSFNFRETLMGHLLLYGNAYAQIVRNARGEVMGLYPLMPNKMTVDRDGEGNLYYLYSRGSDDAPMGKENGQIYLPPSDVLHIPGLGYDGIVGYSPLAMAKNAVGMAIACEEYGAKFFANGAAPGGVLEHPGTIKDPQKVKESWNAAYQGSGNSHRVAVLEEGMKYQTIGISPEQAQFLETRKFQINEIARIYRVPPHMVGDLEKSSFSNIEQQSLEFVKYTLDPWICRWEQSLARRLFSESEKREYFIRFNVEGLLRGDYQSRMNGYAVARQNGWMSANDIRELENLDRIPAEAGGDLYLVNGSMTKLADAGAFAAKTETEVQISE
jgi:HK97 family phage portal protein|nr:MAG TPA: Portal [Caudoviricetes sp.]